MKANRRLAITGVAVAGVLINVAIWYGIPQLLSSSNADTYHTNPATTSSNVPTPSGTPGDPDSPVDASGSPSPSASPSASASQPGGHPNPGGSHPGGAHPTVGPTKTNNPPPPKPKTQTVNAEHSGSSVTFTWTPTSISASPSAADGWSAGTIKNGMTIYVIFSGANNAKETIAGSVQNGALQIDRGWQPPSTASPGGS